MDTGRTNRQYILISNLGNGEEDFAISISRPPFLDGFLAGFS